MTAPVSHIIQHLLKVDAKRNLADKMGILPRVKALQSWQCERLLASHQDLAQQSRYQLAMGFFVDELYGPKDFSQRDADIARVVPKLAKVLPQKAMDALHDALALNALSFELDLAVVEAMGDQALNRDNYAAAYRATNMQAEREQQLAIIEDLGAQLADVIKIRGIGMLIKLARKPAKMAGLIALHEFLERGFTAFKALGDVHSFIDPVLERERLLMQQLFDPSRDLSKDNPLPHV